MTKRLHAIAHEPEARRGGRGRREFGNAQLPLHDETHGSVIAGTPKHLPRILELMHKGVSEGRLVARSKQEISRDMRMGNCFLYEKGGSVVGMAFLVVYDKRMAEVRSIYVEDGARSNGGGAALVKAVLRRGKDRGIDEIMLITKKENAAWFMGHGFGTEANNFRVALFAKAGD